MGCREPMSLVGEADAESHVGRQAQGRSASTETEGAEPTGPGDTLRVGTKERQVGGMRVHVEV